MKYFTAGNRLYLELKGATNTERAITDGAKDASVWQDKRVKLKDGKFIHSQNIDTNDLGGTLFFGYEFITKEALDLYVKKIWVVDLLFIDFTLECVTKEYEDLANHA